MEPHNTAAVLWPSLPVPLNIIFHSLVVSWALQRSYRTQFQGNLTGKGQKQSYKIGPQVYDHSRDVHWLILGWNSLSKVRKWRKLQDATEIQGFGKVISSSSSESHSSGLQNPLSFPDIGQMPLSVGICLMDGWFGGGGLSDNKQTKLNTVLKLGSH